MSFFGGRIGEEVLCMACSTSPTTPVSMHQLIDLVELYKFVVGLRAEGGASLMVLGLIFMIIFEIFKGEF